MVAGVHDAQHSEAAPSLRMMGSRRAPRAHGAHRAPLLPRQPENGAGITRCTVARLHEALVRGIVAITALTRSRS